MMKRQRHKLEEENKERRNKTIEMFWIRFRRRNIQLVL